MREQEQKLANVKKSCDVVRKVSKVFSIAIIVAAVLTLISVCWQQRIRSIQTLCLIRLQDRYMRLVILQVS